MMVLCRALGASVSLAWDPSPDPAIVGYRLHAGPISGHYMLHVDTGHQTHALLSGLIERMTYYFVVTAYNTDGLESVPSKEVAYRVPPAEPEPEPRISTLIPASKGAVLGWTSVTGIAYRVIYKDRLEDDYWMSASPVLLAMADRFVWRHQGVATSPQRIYGVVQLPDAALPSVTNEFPAPYVSRYTINADGATLTWTCVPGKTYCVVYKERLEDSDWINASPVLFAMSDSLQWRHREAIAAPQRFYAVALLPDIVLIGGRDQHSPRLRKIIERRHPRVVTPGNP